MSLEYIIIAGLVGLVLGGVVVFLYFKNSASGVVARANIDAEAIKQNSLREAESRAKEIELKAKQDQLLAKEQFEKENESTRRKLSEQESRLGKREDMLDKKDSTLIFKERNLDDLDTRLGKREKGVIEKETEVGTLVDEQKNKLLQITGLTVDQARTMLLQLVEDDSKIEAGEIIKRYEDEAQENGKEKARQIIIQAIQRIASEQASEHTTSMVTIGDDAMKGRVIGREGRNIRAFEKATGVDVIIDDTPGVVIVSCFDPVRREIAKQTLEKAHPRWPHPPGTHRRNRGRDRQADGRESHQARQGSERTRRRDEPREADPAAPGPPRVPHQLRAERPEALDRSGVPLPDHGR